MKLIGYSVNLKLSGYYRACVVRKSSTIEQDFNCIADATAFVLSYLQAEGDLDATTSEATR